MGRSRLLKAISVTGLTEVASVRLLATSLLVPALKEETADVTQTLSRMALVRWPGLFMAPRLA